MCSRRVWELQQAGELSVTLHCKENGNFEELQCTQGWCYCVTEEDGQPYGTSMPEVDMALLPCCKETRYSQRERAGEIGVIGLIRP